MSTTELRGWLHEWQDYNRKNPVDSSMPYHILAVESREGVTDFEFHDYKSVAYEAVVDGVIVARTEGRDALERLIIMISQLMWLRMEGDNAEQR
jgi:hypothetical protein